MPSAVDYAAGRAWVVHAVPGVDLLPVRVGSGPARTRPGTRKGRRGLDHGTRVIVFLTLTGSIWGGIVLRSWVPELDTPAPNALLWREPW
jgi:hypothetical protein